MTPFGGTAPAVAVFDNYWGVTLAFARSLGEKGVPLHFYGGGAGRWSRYCTRRFSCPPTEKADEFLPWLRERVSGGDISRIAPTTDLIAYYVSALREEFAQEVRRTIAPLAEIVNCLIKTRFSAISATAGHPTLAALAPDTLEGAVAVASVLGYPLMLKPNSHLGVGYAERGTLILNESDLRRRFRRFDVHSGQEHVAAAYPELLWPLMQRYLPSARNRVYSVTGIKDADGGILAAALSYKREQWPPHIGTSTVQVGCEDARILEAGLQIVNRVLSRGIFELELLADGEVLYAIDLNPRAFGFLELDLARGCDLPWLWYRSTIEPPAPAPMPLPRACIEARHRLMHVMEVLAQPFRGPGARSNAAGCDSGGLRQSVSMLGSWSDPVPMIISNWCVLRHPRSFLRAQIASLRASRRPRDLN